jgi:hypothetical protein
MLLAGILSLLFLTPQSSPPSSDDVTGLWARAVPWQQFIDGVKIQRTRWLQNWSRAQAPDDLTDRLRRASAGAGLLVVAEDWCVDSANTLPYIVKMASAAGVETKVLDRSAGAALMDRHRAFDGRRVTPVVIVVRGSRDLGAWIERPAALQDLFRGMASDPEKARRFADRQAWYDADHGRSTQQEVVNLVERTKPATPHDMDQMAPMAPHEANSWHVEFDGMAFGTFDEQGGPRGKTEVRSQNWLMGMIGRNVGASNISFTIMLSAEPLTVGPAGYSEIFQEGEAYHGLQITDRQHPHNLFMQLSATWRRAIGRGTGVTIAGGPVGEAALGPVAFMHRPSSSENPTAPLSHHIFDSTHVTEGVVLGRIDHGRFALEGSVFRGREPDEHRYDIELGKLDSWSVRGWFSPTPAWTIQASHGFLHDPEQLEPGDQRRTNASASWLRERGSNYAAVTVAVGRVDRTYSVVGAVLAEGTSHGGRTEIVHHPHPGELVDPISALTAGAVRDVATIRGLSVGIGGDATGYAPPTLLQVTHGDHPVSFHVFVRIERSSGRMWNMTMGSHGFAGDHTM